MHVGMIGYAAVDRTVTVLLPATNAADAFLKDRQAQRNQRIRRFVSEGLMKQEKQ